MSKARIEWMDFLRGLCILLIIVQHAHIFLLVPYHVASFFFGLEAFFEPFRMQILFFLSGAIALKSSRKNNGTYFLGKISNLLYPYLFWSMAYLIPINMDRFLNADDVFFIQRIIFIFIGATDLTWFLFFLFVFFTLIYFLKDVNPCLVFLIFILLKIFFDEHDIYNYNGLEYFKPYLRFSDLFYYFIFFFSGFVLGDVNLIKLSSAPGVIIISVLSFAVVESINYYLHPFKTSLLYLLPVMLTMPLFLFVSNFTSSRGGRLAAGVRFIGKNSIYYYLLHLLILKFIFFVVDGLGANYYVSFTISFLSTMLLVYIFLKLKDAYPIFNKIFTLGLGANKKDRSVAS